VSRDFEVGSK